MQSQEEKYIREVEAAFGAGDQFGADKINEMISRPDALNLVPQIFEISQNSYILFAGIEILKKHIKDNWPALTEGDKAEVKGFVLNAVSSCTDPQIQAELDFVVAQIAIRSYPDDWPDFLSTAFTQSDYGQIKCFLDEIKTAPVEILTSERKANIIKELVENAPDFMQSMVREYKNSASALNSYICYVKWDMVSQVDFDYVLTDDSDAFEPLCSILQIEGVPNELIFVAFDAISQFEVEIKTFQKIIPVLQKHIYVLENEDHIQNLINVHMRLFTELDFIELLYYWEPFVVSIYAQFQKSGGLTQRFHLHYPILTKIRDYVVFNMVQPPDFIIPDTPSSSNDQAQLENYNSMRSILISFIGMTPQQVNDSFLEGIQFLKENYNQENFLSIIWTLSCIPGSTKSQLESAFVIESMKFILLVFQKPDIDKSVVATSFLFLAAAYARAQKLTPDFIGVTLKLAMEALTSSKTQKTAANTLLSIAKKSTHLIQSIPEGLIDIISGATISADIFCLVAEACGRICQAKTKKIDQVIEKLVTRFGEVSSCDEINFKVVEEQIIVMNGFVGLSRVDSSAIEKVVIKYREIFTKITESFGEQILQIYEENGSDSVEREDVHHMLEFIRAETILFKELVFKDCGDILTLYNTFPVEIKEKFPESLQLAEALFKTKLDETVVNGLRETVVQPTEDMISESPGEYTDHEELLPRVLDAMATSYFESINSGDIEFLISTMKGDSHLTVLGAIRAIDTIVDKADMKLIDQPRNDFFSNLLVGITYQFLFAITDSNHSFCYSQLLRILYKLFDFVATGKVRCQLFEEEEDNVKGMVIQLSEMTVNDFPILSVQEIAPIIHQLFEEKVTMEKFEENVAQYISKTRQTTQVETLDSLRIQQFKNSMSDFFYY